MGGKPKPQIEQVFRKTTKAKSPWTQSPENGVTCSDNILSPNSPNITSLSSAR